MNAAVVISCTSEFMEQDLLRRKAENIYGEA